MLRNWLTFLVYSLMEVYASYGPGTNWIKFLRWEYVYTMLMIIEAGSLWLPKSMMSLVLFERRIMKHSEYLEVWECVYTVLMIKTICSDYWWRVCRIMKHLEYLEVWKGVFSVTHSKILRARNQERHRKMHSRNN